MMEGIIFEAPKYFYLMLLLPLMAVWHWWKYKTKLTSVKMASMAGFEGYKKSFRQYLEHLPFVFRMLTTALLITCLARPQSASRSQNISTEGIDIMLAMDVSSSMLAEDFKPNRIEASKKVVMDFVQGRNNDRIGLVIFSGESFTQCPLTSDHSVLLNLLGNLQTGVLADGTAIGDGLATSVNHIKESKAKSKVIILITDGVNNQGAIAPLTAAEIAKTFNIRVYTIGVGTIGVAPYPMQTPYGIQYQNMPVDLDEPMLKKIAGMADGKYFRATNNNKLNAIYKEIDRLEKTKIEVTEFRKHAEEYLPFALLAGLFLLLEILLRYTLLKSLPS
jgi:Ca-activated chloride channel family protein